MPVSIARLRELIELAGTEGVGGLDVTEGGVRIRILRQDGGPVRALAKPASDASKPLVATADPDIFRSPMFGVLHLTPSPDAAPYVKLGDRVAKGGQLCLIEAMKMFTPIFSDRDGRIEAVFADPGDEVASGQPLFRIVGS